MKSTIKVSAFGFVASVAFGASAALAGCGGDTVNVNDLFTGDASVGSMDATVHDSGLPDTFVPPPVDANACGTLTSCDGTCVDTTKDAANCGGCGNVCASGNVCANGTCALSCNGGSLACGASCVDQTSDPNNCGACGTKCSIGQVCSLGTCGTSCATGLSICSIGGGAAVDAGTGGTMGGGENADAGATDAGFIGAVNICTNELTDANNCGGCGNVCPAGQLCSNGICGVSCLAGLVQCGGKCVDPTSNNAFCGATAGCGGDAGSSAGTACTNGQVCTGGPAGTGVCATSCATNEVNCGGTCIDPTADRFACGASGNCTDVNAMGSTANSAGVQCGAGTVCVAPGVCAVTCLAGEVNCNGTCVDPKTNSLSCGASGDCTGANAGANCLEDANGHALGEVCSNGACVPNCAQGQVNCGGTCVDPKTDGAFCGAAGDCTTHTPAVPGDSAGKNCATIPGTLCSGGTCQVTCQTGQVDCNGTCIDPLTNTNACGAAGDCTNVGAGNRAGTDCSTQPGTVCSGGSCTAACLPYPAQLNCSGSCIDPMTDNAHCGAKGDCSSTDANDNPGVACSAGSICSGGVCTSNCGGAVGIAICGNACVDTLHDPNNCGTPVNGAGGCVACNGANVATNVCRSGVCAVGACAAGFGACNGETTGCNENLKTDSNNCGVCGNVCAAGFLCSAGACVDRPNVAIVAAAGASTRFTSVQTYLVGTGRFTSVSVIDAGSTTPTLATLKTFSAVLVWSNSSFADATTLGNNLADYYDAGGRVVTAVFSNASIPLSGRFVTGGYMLLNAAGQTAVADSLGTILEPASDLVAGVTTLSCTGCFESTGGTINGGVVTASWSSGAPMIVHGTIGGRDRVELNVYPPPVSERSDFVSGNYAALFSNALLH